VDYVNGLSPVRNKSWMMPLGHNANLHPADLHVQPESPQDDVLPCLRPGGRSGTQSASAQPVPGLYWYHTHQHNGELSPGISTDVRPIVVEASIAIFRTPDTWKRADIRCLRDAWTSRVATIGSDAQSIPGGKGLWFLNGQPETYFYCQWRRSARD